MKNEDKSNETFILKSCKCKHRKIVEGERLKYGCKLVSGITCCINLCPRKDIILYEMEAKVK